MELYFIIIGVAAIIDLIAMGIVIFLKFRYDGTIYICEKEDFENYLFELNMHTNDLKKRKSIRLKIRK